MVPEGLSGGKMMSTPSRVRGGGRLTWHLSLWAEEPVPVAVRTRSSGHRDGFLAAFRSPDRPLAVFPDRVSQVRSSFSDVLSLSPETMSRNNAHSYDVITYMHVALG